MIWLIGSKGMLGTAVEKQLQTEEIEYSATDMDVDITSTVALKTHGQKIFAGDSERWIINCSAYTAVDKAEDEPGLAARINTEGVGNIAQCASCFNAKMIHISTDYVFNGKSSEPLSEDAETSPVSVYGKTKLEGEKAAGEFLESLFIIRTAWLYGVNGSNFVYTMLNLMESRESVSVVDDQRGSPTNAEDLAGLITDIIKRDSTAYGIYHFSNEGNISWFEFASEIYRLARVQGLLTSECSVNPCGSEQYPTKAKRPAYSLLSKDKVKRTFEIDVPEWKESLTDFIKNIEEII